MTSDARHPLGVSEKNKDMTRHFPFVSFWPGFGLSNTLYNLTIWEKDVICVQSSNCPHGLQESLQKLSDSIVWGEAPCRIS